MRSPGGPGVTKGAIYDNFESKDAMIVAMGPTRTREHLLELFAPEELPMPVEAFALLLHSLIPGLAQFRAIAPRPPSQETILAMFEGLAPDPS